MRRLTLRATGSLLPLLLVASVTVYARADTLSSRSIGAWTVAESEDGRGCFISRTYDGSGQTTLLFGQDVDGSHRLSVVNRNWSIKPGERWKLDFRLSNGGYAKHAVVGIAAPEGKGFVTRFDAKFPGHFASSRAIHVDRGDVPVERLNLDGSATAMAALRRCVAELQSLPTIRKGGSERPEPVPRDPFARRSDK